MRGVLLRGEPGGERAATPLELFFDLCFVVAVAQVAATLHGDPTIEGAAVAAGLFVPVWWAWMAFTWQATAYDTGDAAHRIGTLAAMLGVLALAVGTGDAAAGEGAAFALAAAALRLPLAALWLRVHRRAPRELRGFSARYLAGTGWAIALWAVSAPLSAPLQQILWAIAIAGEIAAPYAAVRTLDRPAYHPSHIVERYGLFTIIVLGESILAVVVGTSHVEIGLEAGLTGAFGFAAAAAIWWLYFDRVGAAGLGTTRGAGFTWGYGHLAVWAGIAALGVGTELAIERTAAEPMALAGAETVPAEGSLPLEVMPLAAALALAALALIASTAPTAASRRSVRFRLATAVALGVLAVLAGPLGPLPLALCVALVLVGTAAADRDVAGRSAPRQLT